MSGSLPKQTNQNNNNNKKPHNHRFLAVILNLGNTLESPGNLKYWCQGFISPRDSNTISPGYGLGIGIFLKAPQVILPCKG